MEKTIGGWYVYKHTSPDGKVYIGACKDLKHRWRGNGSGYRGSGRFYDAICEIGWNNFKHEVIAQGLSQTDAHKLEHLLISEAKSNDEQFGYNMQSGGIAGKCHCRETKEKMSEAAKKRYENQEERILQSMRMKECYKSHEYRDKVQNAIRKARCRAVKCVETGDVFESASDAARITGINRACISEVCSGRKKTIHGLHWEYVVG